MYPQLTVIFGEAYAGKLLADHGGAIRNARELQHLAGYQSLTEQQAERAVELTRQILPHVSDCDRLSIMVEPLAKPAVGRSLASRHAALGAELDLPAWSATSRDRRA
jgi:hypothetical protein